MKEWLTIIVVLLIVGILLDGWRRMRASRRDNIRLSPRARSFEPSDSQPSREAYTSELPNGGARVISKRERAEAERAATGHSHKPQQGQSTSQIPQQVSLNLDESVPMLMESVEPDSGATQAEPHADKQAPQEPTFASQDETGADNGREFSRDDQRREPVFSALDETQDTEPVFTESEPEPPGEPDEVIIINVMAPEGQYFSGSALLDILLQTGMRFGDMNIFHRHAQDNGEGPVLFSLANMVKPGVFDLDAMDDFYTPGVSMFLTLPMRADSIKAFDIMRSCAEAIAEALGGELKDENRSVMTHQTMEHCRQRIAEYERKRLSRAGT